MLPRPGSEEIRSSPPTERARSRIEMRPKPLPGTAVSNPRPLSLTRSRTREPTCSRLRFTRLAPLWRAALVTASQAIRTSASARAAEIRTPGGEVKLQSDVEPFRDLDGRVREGNLDGLSPGSGTRADCPPRFQLRPLNSALQAPERVLVGFPVKRIEVAREVGQLLRQPIVQVAGDPPLLLERRRR